MLRILTIAGFLVLVVPAMKAQETTNTNCTVYDTTANCTSTTTNNAAQQQQAYEAGQKVGDAIGMGIAAGIESHRRSSWVKHFCAAHPGEGWKWTRNSDGRILASGNCSTDESKALAAANTFMSRHREYIKNQANSQTLVAYLDTHNLDPTRREVLRTGIQRLEEIRPVAAIPRIEEVFIRKRSKRARLENMGRILVWARRGHAIKTSICTTGFLIVFAGANCVAQVQTFCSNFSGSIACTSYNPRIVVTLVLHQLR